MTRYLIALFAIACSSNQASPSPLVDDDTGGSGGSSTGGRCTSGLGCSQSKGGTSSGAGGHAGEPDDVRGGQGGETTVDPTGGTGGTGTAGMGGIEDGGEGGEPTSTGGTGGTGPTCPHLPAYLECARNPVTPEEHNRMANEIPMWVRDTTYAQGDRVWLRGAYFECNVVEGCAHPPSPSLEWTLIHWNGCGYTNLCEVSEPWTSCVRYTANDYVGQRTSEGIFLFKCVSAGSCSVSPPPGNSSWHAVVFSSPPPGGGEGDYVDELVCPGY